MREKLSKYYTRTEFPFVYVDAVILDPYGKLLIFDQPSFANDRGQNWKEKYEEDFQDRFIKYYQGQNKESSITNTRKRKKADTNDDFEDDYYKAITKAQVMRGRYIEVDSYLSNIVSAPDTCK